MPMERIEQAVIRACFQETYTLLGFDTQREAAKALQKCDDTITDEQALKYVQTHPVGAMAQLSAAALQIIGEQADVVTRRYNKDTKDPHTREYLEHLLHKYGNRGRANNIDMIYANWKRPSRRGRDAFRTGIYQIYRRYKPIPSERTSEDNRRDHYIICEIILLNADSMECLMVTCQRNVYHGSLYINTDDLLYGIVQRPNAKNTGIHQRLFCMKLERRRLPMYSALMIKTGDTVGRPISSECMFVEIPKREHHDLYAIIEEMYGKGDRGNTPPVPPTSIVMDYITAPPPQTPPTNTIDWERVRYLKDFPIFDLMASRDEWWGTPTMFREPQRTLSAEMIAALAKRQPISVFQHSTSPGHSSEVLEPAS
jgi:hypothetical protein